MKADPYLRLLKIFIEGFEKILDKHEEKELTWETMPSEELLESIAKDVMTLLYLLNK